MTVKCRLRGRTGSQIAVVAADAVDEHQRRAPADPDEGAPVSVDGHHLDLQADRASGISPRARPLCRSGSVLVGKVTNRTPDDM